MDIFVRITLFVCCVLTGNMAIAEEPVCTVKGRVYTELKWYGYLVQKPFHRDWAKIQYQITYPAKECCTNLLIYYDDQIRQLKEDMTCKERENILPANNNQIIPLYKNNRTIGCNIWNETGEPYYVCLGERIFRSSGPRTWYFALSRCDSVKPLNLNYVFNVSGFYGECEQDPLGKAVVPPIKTSQDQYMYVSLGLGILAGVALITAAVFFALWFLGRRQNKSKGSSVTSSQATMTQDDVFYVNPSLSDQGQTDYSQTSSENYYEVIPERRSYESINSNNLAAMQGQPHALALAAHHNRHLTSVKDFRPFHHQPMSLCVDDYPPPPYQPPRMMHGMPKHHTLHHPPHHHPHHGHHPHLHPQLHPQQYTIHRDRPMAANTSSQQQTLPTHTETSA